MENSTEKEIINGLISYEGNNFSGVGSEVFDHACRISVENRLQQVNAELERYTVRADTLDYSIAVASGIIAGVVDSVFTGEFSLERAHEWGSEKTEQFVVKLAKAHKPNPYKGDDVSGAIRHLAGTAKHKHSTMNAGYRMVSDTRMDVLGGTNQHHLRDFAHHASAIGLLFSILTQFTEKCYGTDTTGAFIIVPVKENDLIYIGKDVPEKLLFGIVYWFFHLVSDVAGSGDPVSEGTGIPGPILSTAKLLAATPLFSNATDEKGNREFSVFVSKLFNGTQLGERGENGKIISRLRFDFRTELGLGHFAAKQAFPVILNEVCVRTFYMLRRFTDEVSEKRISGLSDLEKLNWNAIKPWGNRTVERMVTVARVTFSFADTADAAVHAALESGGNWVLFSGRFFARINYIGAGRAVIAVVKEVSSDIREAQLLKERRLLMETNAEIAFEQLQLFKEKLEETISTYLAEDIKSFIEGFDYINEGLEKGDSDMVIKGNVVIQKVLGREPQFTNQQEFEAMMESDAPLIF